MATTPAYFSAGTAAGSWEFDGFTKAQATYAVNHVGL